MFDKIAKKLSENTEYSYEVSIYILRTYTHLFISLGLILLIAYFLGVFKSANIIILVFMILRAFSGGVHSESKIICTTISLLVSIGGGLLITNLISFSNNFILLISTLTYFLGIYIILNYSPADTAQKPIISIEFKKQLRRNALIFITLLEIIIFILKIIDYHFFQNIALSIIWGLFFQLFSILPISYLITKILDNTFCKTGDKL